MMAIAKNDDESDGPQQPSGERTLSFARLRAQRPAMTYHIVQEESYLRAELAHCETVAEMRSFLRAVVRNCVRASAIVIRVRASKPVFHVERDGLIASLLEIARHPRHRIALLGDSPDQQASLEYLELIARQRGVRVRCFRAEAEALAWFSERRMQDERRLGGERRRNGDLRPLLERRAGAERRRHERRLPRSARGAA